MKKLMNIMLRFFSVMGLLFFVFLLSTCQYKQVKLADLGGGYSAYQSYGVMGDGYFYISDGLSKHLQVKYSPIDLNEKINRMEWDSESHTFHFSISNSRNSGKVICIDFSIIEEGEVDLDDGNLKSNMSDR